MDNFNCDDKINQDPDYLTLFNTNETRQNIFEKNSRNNAAKQISEIIENEFLHEINNKKTEIFEIYKRLNKACKMLHYLRFAIVTDFYNNENLYNEDAHASKQLRPHPAIVNPSLKKMKDVPTEDSAVNCLPKLNTDQNNVKKRKLPDEFDKPKKKNLQLITTNQTLDFSNSNSKIKKRLIIGNISKWIHPDFRDDNASHKWTVYIRDSQNEDIGAFISKVRFFLHPSYKPNDVVELTSTPFYLSRHGWGEFPIRVQLHFVNSFDKPVDIIHQLKLDRTFTGLQTIGSETVVDLWISAKYVPITHTEKTSDKENIILVDKNEKLSEKERNSDTIEKCPYFIDHDYMGTNSKPNVNTSHFEKSQTHINVSDLVKNNVTDKFSKYDSVTQKNNNLLINSNKNIKSLLKHDCNELSEKEVHNSVQYEKLSLNNKQTTNDDLNLLNNLESRNKQIYFKYENRFYNIVDTKLKHSKALISVIDEAKPNNLFSMLKFITNRMPLITEKSTDPYYKLLHPYACESYELFNEYNKGKQRSLERYRAISALKILENTKYYNTTCSVQEFIIWARRYCYTPLISLKSICKSSSDIEDIENDNNSYKQTSTISNELNEWFSQCQKSKPNICNIDPEDEEEIDVLNTPDVLYNNDFSSAKSSNLENTSLVLIDYPESQDSFNDFVCKTTQKIGIKLVNEEIVPGVSHNAATLLITKAVKCLINDLVRLSYASALDEMKIESNIITVDVNNVHTALLRKEEFEIFTNAGLGSQG